MKIFFTLLSFCFSLPCLSQNIIENEAFTIRLRLREDLSGINKYTVVLKKNKSNLSLKNSKGTYFFFYYRPDKKDEASIMFKQTRTNSTTIIGKFRGKLTKGNYCIGISLLIDDYYDTIYYHFLVEDDGSIIVR